MRNLSSLIASTAHHGEQRSTGAWMAGVFVAVLLIGSAAAAYFIGNAMAANSASPPPMAMIAGDGF